jgi:hypothetical protein
LATTPVEKYHYYKSSGKRRQQESSFRTEEFVA